VKLGGPNDRVAWENPAMYVLFEDAGKFMAGRIMSEAEASAQVELDSGKRVKVKAAHMLLRFDKPAPAALLLDAAALSQTIELELAYECAPDEEFGFGDLAKDYFSASASNTEQVAALLRLHEAPHYFRRGGGKGRFRKAPAEIVQQALLAIEKKKQVQAQIEAWSAELVAGSCPESIREQLYKILFRPDKNTPEYKAVVEASKSSQTAPLDLLQNAGAIASPWDFHWQRFLFDLFPKGTGFPALQAPAITDDLPLAPVQAFSIDDSHTTEIDDALSLQGLGTGTVTVGIHIAAPGLALSPGSPIDQLGRARGWSALGRAAGLNNAIVCNPVTRKKGPGLAHIFGRNPQTPTGARQIGARDLVNIGHAIDIDPALGCGHDQIGAAKAKRPQEHDPLIQILAALTQQVLARQAKVHLAAIQGRRNIPSRQELDLNTGQS
jgi:hypothetical protein